MGLASEGKDTGSSQFFFNDDWNVHLDGLHETHDKAVERDGVFDAAIAGIKAAKAAGHMVCTNTTVYKDTDIDEIDAKEISSFSYGEEKQRYDQRRRSRTPRS